jgi:hypothetical protein
MSAPHNPLSDLSHRPIAFWLPPGGADNGVWASNWAELADLDLDDIATVLALLARAGIGGYVATPGGRARRHRKQVHRLWVDSLQYHRAEDVLMAHLNRRPHR